MSGRTVTVSRVVGDYDLTYSVELPDGIPGDEAKEMVSAAFKAAKQRVDLAAVQLFGATTDKPLAGGIDAPKLLFNGSRLQVAAVKVQTDREHGRMLALILTDKRCKHPVPFYSEQWGELSLALSTDWSKIPDGEYPVRGVAVQLYEREIGNKKQWRVHTVAFNKPELVAETEGAN
jgi:hypothetical protein